MGRYPIPDEENAKLAVPFPPLSEYKHVYSTPGGPTVYMRPIGKITQDQINRMIQLNVEIALRRQKEGKQDV